MKVQVHWQRMVLYLLMIPGCLVVVSADDETGQRENFERRVRPLLANRCYNCHSADTKAAGGLRLDDGAGVLAGGGRGPAVVPGRPDESLLVRAISWTDTGLQMPPDSRLSEEEREILRVWIESGAWWPPAEAPGDIGLQESEYVVLRRDHWSWQPLQRPSVPSVRRHDWVADPVDAFVLSGLEHAGLSPVGDADRSVLLRRVTFDLTGLPPTPDELRAFLADAGEGAWERVVDRLLASRFFGEHWGRHWLDVARFGESTGSARNLPYPQAWRYRNYVIDALNSDKPYDQFVREQVAGDLLPWSGSQQRREQLTATGFLAIGVKDVNQRFRERFILDNVDEQIDVVTRGLLGLSVSCARCHDHKFDPIPTRDYYALAGIFESTDLCAGVRNKMGGGGLDYYDSSLLLFLGEATEPTEERRREIERARAVVEDLRLEFERIRDSADAEKLGPTGRSLRQIARQKWNRAQADLLALTDPASTVETALGVRDGVQPGDGRIRYRGIAEQPGPVVRRGFLSVLPASAPLEIPAGASGRLQLAEWLTSEGNPLLTRVLVNRVWLHLFGRGIVGTPDNFGVTGELPSHPELLDYLAIRLRELGWSQKRLIREIVLSRAYRLSGAVTAEHLLKDPENRLIWRHSPRRLTAEEVRDSQLLVSGRLDVSRPESSVAATLKVTELRDNGPEARAVLAAASASRHRSVYLPLLRSLTPAVLEAFDPVDQNLPTGLRESTTVASQPLYLLNSPFVRRTSLGLAESLRSEAVEDLPGELWLRVLGRLPSASERESAEEYLVGYAAEAGGLLGPEFERLSGFEGMPATTAGVADRAGEVQAAALANPDDVGQEEEAPPEDLVIARDPHTAALQSLIQALMGSGEFLYVR
jgi:hypothetical protein